MRILALALLATPLVGCVEEAPASRAPEPFDPVDPPQALLWRAPYTRIVLEADHVEGREPHPGVLESIASELANATGKTVDVVGSDLIEDTPPDPARRRTADELLELHRRSFQSDPDPERLGRGDAAYVHALFPDGTHEEALAGISIGNVVVVFRDGMPTEIATSPLHGPRGERGVLLHELGHTLGLVNCGIPMIMPRERGMCHSDRPRSVMYSGNHDWIDEFADDFVRDRGFREDAFDEHDLLDLAAFIAAGPAAR